MYASEKKEAARAIKKALQKEFGTKFHHFSVTQSYGGFDVSWSGFLNGTTTEAVKKIADNWSTVRDISCDSDGYGDPIWVGESVDYCHNIKECPSYDGWDYEAYNQMVIDHVCKEHNVTYEIKTFHSKDYYQDMEALGYQAFLMGNNSCQLEDRPEDWNERRYPNPWKTVKASVKETEEVVIEEDPTIDVEMPVIEFNEEISENPWAGVPQLMAEMVAEIDRLRHENLELKKAVAYEQELRSRVTEQRNEAEAEADRLFHLLEQEKDIDKQWEIDKQAEAIDEIKESLADRDRTIEALEWEIKQYRSSPVGGDVTEEELELLANRLGHMILRAGGHGTDLGVWLPRTNNPGHQGSYYLAKDMLRELQQYTQIFAEEDSIVQDPCFVRNKQARAGGNGKAVLFRVK